MDIDYNAEEDGREKVMTARREAGRIEFPLRNIVNIIEVFIYTQHYGAEFIAFVMTS